jgi:hypothetical protein
MKKIILLLVVVAVVFVVWSRQRLYVRDPLGSVMRDVGAELQRADVRAAGAAWEPGGDSGGDALRGVCGLPDGRG